MKNKARNEVIKRRYFRWMEMGEGFSRHTLRNIKKAIWLYEDFADHEDFGKFNSERAIGFREFLEANPAGKKKAKLSTQYICLRYLKAFFSWLATQPGYKSKIKIEDASYLRLEKRKVHAATASPMIEVPSLDWVRQLVSSIEPITEIDRRDRALISLLVLSGMRDCAVATLPLGCFDRHSKLVSQIYDKGVETKFGKTIYTYLIPFDNQLLDCVLEWAEYLVSTRRFSATDPMFPRNKVEQKEGELCFSSDSVEPLFWKGAGPIRRIIRSRCEPAGLKYYYPHSFRHLTARLAIRLCRTMEQMQAVSQNFGHEYIATTFRNYCNLEPHTVGEIVEGLSADQQIPAEIDPEMVFLVQNLAKRMREKGCRFEL